MCHDTKKYLDANICLGETGFRKVIMDPRKISALGSFDAQASEGAEGVDLRTSAAVYNHMQDEFTKTDKWCSEIYQEGQGPEWWVRDTFLRDYGQSLRDGKRCEFAKGPCVDKSQ